MPFNEIAVPIEASRWRVVMGLFVMMPERRDSLAAQRCSLRRRREDEAPKLHGEVPGLTSLWLEVEERTDAGATKHIRRFVVERAPALFLVPCGDPRCAGEHDLTATVMRALRARESSFRGSDECTGSVGSSSCPRAIRFQGTAEYRDALQS
jgi:hypothetical protein